MEHLFTYRTLQNKSIQLELFGRLLKGNTATLIGYKLHEIQIEDEGEKANYPIIKCTNNPNDSINGIVYEITEMELRKADEYEGIHYSRVQVTLESKQNVWAYITAT